MPPAPGDGLHETSHLPLVRDVGHHREDLVGASVGASVGAPKQLFTRAFEEVLAPVANGHTASRPAEGFSRLKADAAAGAGDYSDLAAQLYQSSFLLSISVGVG